MIGKILKIKKSEVKKVKFDEIIQETAIQKEPVNEVFVEKLGIVGDDVGQKEFHGGVDKAIFFVSEYTYEKLNQITNSNFNWENVAFYGENFVVSKFNEENVCVGDIFQIGECKIEISQPRKPCATLSRNTKVENMRDIIYESGMTGWYARVLEEGKVKNGDKFELVERVYPNLTILKLNKLLSTDENESLLREAINCEKLAMAFKKALIMKLDGNYVKPNY